MPYCPRCRFEYREGVRACPECGGALAAGSLAPEGPPVFTEDPETEPVLLCRIADSSEAEMVCAALREAGIFCMQQTSGPITARLTQVSNGHAPEDCTRIHVAKNRLAEAQAIIETLREAPIDWPAGLEPED